MFHHKHCTGCSITAVIANIMGADLKGFCLHAVNADYQSIELLKYMNWSTDEISLVHALSLKVAVSYM